MYCSRECQIHSENVAGKLANPSLVRSWLVVIVNGSSGYGNVVVQQRKAGTKQQQPAALPVAAATAKTKTLTCKYVCHGGVAAASNE